MTSLKLRIFGIPVQIVANDGAVIDLLARCYSAFKVSDQTSPDALTITIEGDASTSGWTVLHQEASESCGHLADLIYVVEKTMTIELQRRRSDLFFLHGAAVGLLDRCAVIIGESGAGKSTFCWELCNSGFTYLSDELAPVELRSMRVEPYPHAICLKRVTDGMPDLPDATIDATATYHIPVESIPGPIARHSHAVEALIFLSGQGGSGSAGLTEISQSEAAARLYANGLNQLAHERNGLTAAARVAAAGVCFTMQRSSLDSMRKELLEYFDANK